jgi:hypothetical protein
MKGRFFALFLSLIVTVSLGGCVVVADDPNRGGGGSGSSGDNMSASMTVVNNASQAVYYIYFSAANETTWGQDMLPMDVLSPGESCTIRCTPGSWDIKCVMKSGQELVYYNQYIDGAYTLTITDN